MKTNSNYTKRKQIIEPLKAEFGMGFQMAPLRQILSLKLTPMQQLILLNFFSHDYRRYRLSINAISKSFGKRKNRSDVVTALIDLKTMGYLTVTDYTYKVNLTKINSDYKLSIMKDEGDSPAIFAPDSTAPIGDSPAIIPPDSTAPNGDSPAIILLDSPAITNKGNINEKDKRNNINEIEEKKLIMETASPRSIGSSVGNTGENANGTVDTSGKTYILSYDIEKLEKVYEYYQNSKHSDHNLNKEVFFIALDSYMKSEKLTYSDKICLVTLKQEINRYESMLRLGFLSLKGE